MSRQQELIERFRQASQSRQWIAERIAKGQQFNCYESASNDDDMEDDEREYRLAIGPVNDFAWLFDIEGQDMADMIESALKLAALLAFPEPALPSRGVQSGVRV
jgi:hypothetical protein